MGILRECNMSRRLGHLVAHLCDVSPLEGVGMRIGISLNQPGRRSENPEDASEDVGTVKLFQNAGLIVWDMVVPPASSTGFFIHRHDYIQMQIGDGYCRTDRVDHLTNQVLLGRHVSKVPNQSCVFHSVSQQAPEIHRVHNTSSTEHYRQMIVEFLTDKPRYDAAEVQACVDEAVLSTDIGSGLLFENHRCRVHEFNLAPHSGSELTMHHHTLPYFFVNTCGGQNSAGAGLQGLRGAGFTKDGTVSVLWSNDRDLSWYDIDNGGFSQEGNPEHVHRVWNDLDEPYASFIFELK